MKSIGRDLLTNTPIAGAKAAGGNGRNGIADGSGQGKTGTGRIGNNMGPDPDAIGTHSGFKTEGKGASGAVLSMGSKNNQINQPKNPAYQPVRNIQTNVGGIEYSDHTLDRMQDREIMPSVVGNGINAGVSIPSHEGTSKFYDMVNNITIITNDSGKVVTVRYGK